MSILAFDQLGLLAGSQREYRGTSHREFSRGTPPVKSVAPADLAVNLEDTKLACRISGNDEDSLIIQYIQTAIDAVELDAEIALVTQTRVQYLDRIPDYEIEWRLPPLQSVSSITYTDLNSVVQTLDPTTYQVSTHTRPGVILPVYGQVWPPSLLKLESIAVTGVCGYGLQADVPAIAKIAIYLRVAALYRDREMSTEETASYDSHIRKLQWRGAF